jgi:5'-nucleotidase/UDP-sugar diphosphatase
VFEPRNRIILLLILFTIILSLLITTITFGVLWRQSKSHSNSVYAVNKGTIGFPPILPDDGKYIQWTFLQLNDVYEMLPLDEGRKGGLARVARVRQLLNSENSETYTILSGDFLSPSALSQSKINGTTLNGRQMVASLNTLGLDFVTFGNHEFDLNETELISRMNESKFTWISSNVFQRGSNQPFSSSIRYKILLINEIRILLIGLSIEIDKPYIHIINQTSLIPFVQQFLQSISDVKYDVLIALTHLDLNIDIQLAENLPEIDLILGGHEHEDYFLFRGSKYTPITKADANAVTVYIHRCAFNLNTKRFRVYTTLSQITPELQDEQKTAEVANYWYNLGIQGFEQMGFHPNQTVACLPPEIQLDGRSTSVRNFATLLTDDACQSILQTTINQTKISVFNSGSVRIDDILRGKITQYDILRVFPFQDNIFSLEVPGTYLANLLTRGVSMKGSGAFLAFCGINTFDQGKTWMVNGEDISKTGQNYNVGTISYLKETEFNDPTVIVLKEFNTTQTQALIYYLQNHYPQC